MLVYRLSIAIRNADGHTVRVGRGVDNPGQAQAIAEAGWGQDQVDGSRTYYVLNTWRSDDTVSVLTSSQVLRPANGR